MSIEKIFNFESKILTKETIDKFGYNPLDLGDSSKKTIIATCRYCGKHHEIKKGNFIKKGSACHRECFLEEMKKQKSPFFDPKVREKAKQTIKDKYGSEYASQNKDISKKISNTKKTDISKAKTKKTNLNKYGVENVFQSGKIKDKIKQTNLKKYGVEHHMQNSEVLKRTTDTIKKRYNTNNVMQNKDIRKKAKQTNIKRYGCKSPLQDKSLATKMSKTLKQTVAENKSGNYNLINTLRGDSFWQKLSEEKSTLKNICKEFNLNYQSVTARLLDDEFKNKYYKLYNFPRQQIQKEIKQTLEDLGFKTLYNTRQIITPLELDIYIPDKKFAIEFNGSYWHSEACLELNIAKNKHLIKTQLCRDKGIRLFHIFEYQWRDKKQQILNFIKSILGDNKKIYARKCQINNEECKDFIENNHIQGYGRRTKIYFNLTYNNQIVASMTASSHHRQNINNDIVVLNRLCFADDITVVGGSSKLFKQFVYWAKEEGYKQIVSWSDNLWTEGDIYKTLGFELEIEYKPDYFYWDAKNRIYRSKQSQRKSATGCPKDITEKNFCLANKLYRIYDCGKKKWVYTL